MADTLLHTCLQKNQYKQIVQCHEPLCCSTPEGCYTMGELGLQTPEALCDFAVCAPFQLLSEACVDAMRDELYSKAVQENCRFSNARTPW